MAMKVKELIKQLQNYDENENVVISNDGIYYVNLDEVDFDGEDVIILGEIDRTE